MITLEDVRRDAVIPSPDANADVINGCDLPIDDRGRMYHLQITPELLAPDILIVGDPGRASAIAAAFFEDIEIDHEHRGLRTVTGRFREGGDIDDPKGMRATVVTSGMGTSSLEIVAQELVALNEIDVNSRTRKPDYPRLNIIRVGTSGGLQKDTPLGAPIITTYAAGFDNTGLFYDIPAPDEECTRIERELREVLVANMSPDSRFRDRIFPYVAKVDPRVVTALRQASRELGIEPVVGLTASGSGFFGNQGRDIARVRPSVPDIDRILAGFDPHLEGQRFENMEMEASFLNFFMGGLGYLSGTICPAIANRREDTFDHEYATSIDNATKIALRALRKLRMSSGALTI